MVNHDSLLGSTKSINTLLSCLDITTKPPPTTTTPVPYTGAGGRGK